MQPPSAIDRIITTLGTRCPVSTQECNQQLQIQSEMRSIEIELSCWIGTWIDFYIQRAFLLM